MDPVTIITSVASITKVVVGISTTLFTFVDDTRNVDQTVQAIYDEVTALNRTLDAISSCFTTSSEASIASGKADLWKAVLGSLSDCRGTIDRLDKSLQDVANAGSNVVSQAVRTFKLKYKDEGLKTLRAQIQTHNTALQLALQMISVHLSSVGPGLVIDNLGTKIELLVDMIAQLEISPVRDVAAEPETIDPTIAGPHLESLVVSAQQVVLGANIVLSESEAGSVFGQALNRATRSRIDGWMGISRGRNDLDDETDASTVTSHTQMTPSEMTETVYDSDGGTETGNHVESDPDEEFDFEEVEACIRRAGADFSDKNWPAAELFFERAITTAKLLSVRKQKSLGLRDVQLHLAVCFYHQDKFVEAESAVIDLRTAPVTSQQDAIRGLAATHLLAKIFSKTDRLDQANTECRKALRGRRKRLGKEHPAYYESLGLLSVIMESQGDHVSAIIYRDMIPADTIDPALKRVRDRNIALPAQASTISSSSSPAPRQHVTETQSRTHPTQDPLPGVGSTALALGLGTFLWSGGRTHEENGEPLRAAQDHSVSPPPYSSSEEGWRVKGMSPLRRKEAIKQVELLGPLVAGGGRNDHYMFRANDYDPAKAFMWAADEGNTLIAHLILTGWSPSGRFEMPPMYRNKQLLLNRTRSELSNEFEETPLHVAARKGHLGIIKLHYISGADIDVLDTATCTPLHVALRNAQEKVALYLLKAGADIRRQNARSDYPPIYLLSQSLDLIRFCHTWLLDHGGDTPWHQRQRELALHRGVLGQSKGLVALMLEYGVDINAKDDRGMTAMEHAKEFKTQDMADFLEYRMGKKDWR